LPSAAAAASPAKNMQKHFLSFFVSLCMLRASEMAERQKKFVFEEFACLTSYKTDGSPVKNEF
jgi:hypothetical protein